MTKKINDHLLVKKDIYINKKKYASLHYGNRGKIGQAVNFNPDNNKKGLWIESSASPDPHGVESGGIFLNGSTMCLWSPGDNDLLRVYDEDAFGGSPLPKFVIDGGGNVGVGQPNPTQKLHVQGNMCATGSVGTCSDVRYKKDLEPLNDSLSKVLAMRGTRYHWNREDHPEQEFSEDSQIGFIGQEMESICPEAVFTDSQGYRYLDYSRLTPLFAGAIKEQQKLIEQQRSDLKQAQEMIAQLETIISKSN